MMYKSGRQKHRAREILDLHLEVHLSASTTSITTPSTMTTYSLSPAAYTLPLLHAAAHPSATVSGVLLGTVSGSSVSLTDAIPLIHRYAALSPTTELGIDLAKASAAKEGKAVLGYYVAREGGENTLGRVDERVRHARIY